MTEPEDSEVVPKLSTPETKKGLEQRIDDLLGHLDNDRILNYCVENLFSGNPDDLLRNVVDRVATLRGFEISCQEGNVKKEAEGRNNEDFVEETTLKIEKIFQERGFLKSKSDANDEVVWATKDAVERKAFKERTPAVISELREANALKVQYLGRKIGETDPFLIVLEEVWRIIDSDKEIDLRLIEAVDKKSIKMQKSGRLSQPEDIRQEYLERKRALSRREIISGIEIDGFEQKPEHVLVVDADIIKAKLVGLPVGLLETLRGIKLTEKSVPWENQPGLEENSEKEPNSTIFISGKFSSEYDKEHNFLQGRIEIYLPANIKSDQSSPAFFYEMRKSEIIEDIYHEVGHSVHSNLTFDELKKWEFVVLEDKNPITWYAEHSGKTFNFVGKREDFSDSFKLFMDNPTLLFVISPRRYDYMKQLLRDYIKPEEREDFDLVQADIIFRTLDFWRINGISIEQVKERYQQEQESALLRVSA